MKKLLLFCIILSHSFVWAAEEKTEKVAIQAAVVDPVLERKILALPERTINLLIINDSFNENYAKRSDKEFPFAWRDIVDTTVLAKELLFALTDQQIVLCSKSLWLHIQFLVEMWAHAALMDYDEFYQEYSAHTKMDAQVKKDFQAYTPIIKQLYNLSGYLDDAAHEMVFDQERGRENAQQNFNVACQKLTSFLVDPSARATYSKFSAFFGIDQLYDAVDLLEYECKSVGDHYLLFVPTSLIKRYTTKSALFNSALDVIKCEDPVSRKKTLTPIDVALGLQYSKLPAYEHRMILHGAQSRTIMLQTPKNEEMGGLLISSLRDCIIDRRSIKKDWLDYAFKILPNFNMYVSGHGSSQTVASILHKDFISLLHFFNKQMRTKNFLFGSCCTGGKSIQSLFTASYLYNNPLLESLTYPIMFLGTTQSSVEGPYEDFDFSMICDGCKVYAGQIWAPDNDNYFSRMFALLNAQPLPDYLEAMKLFSRMFDLFGRVEHSMMKNYVSIKFPHTPWIEPMDYGKLVKKITNLSVAVSDKDIVIDQKVAVVLLAANKIDNKIVVSLDTMVDELIFLPVNYHNSYYQLAKLEVLNESKKSDVASFSMDEKIQIIRIALDQLFMRVNNNSLDEHISIFIDQAEIFGIKIDTVLCDVLNRVCSFMIEFEGLKQLYVFRVDATLYTQLQVNQDLLDKLNQTADMTLSISSRPFLPADHYPKQSWTTHRFVRADILDVRATLPPKKQFVYSLEQALQQVPKLAKESRELQQSWSQDKQRKELYDTRKVDPKKPNIHAKPFVPKSVQPKVAVQSVAKSENKYVKHVAPDGKVSWKASSPALV